MLAAMSTARLCALALVLFVTSFTTHALAWPELTPDGPRTPLLGGRWTIALGPDASTAPAAGDPRGPTPRVELDGIATMRAEDGRLVVRATLLFATAPADLEAIVRTLPAPCATPTIAAFPEHAGWIAIRCSEPSPDGALRPIVLYATHTDGWIDRIEVRLEIDEATDRAAATAFADAVVATLRAEDVPAAVERGTVEVARACVAGDAADPFTVTLPEGWIATRQQGGELAMIQIVRVAELGGRRPIGSAVFSPTGAVPARIPAGAGTPHAGRLLGSDVEWLEISQGDDAPGIREVALALSVACGADAPPWTGTLQLSAGGASSTLDESTRVLETLAMGSDRGHTVTLTTLGTEEEPLPEDAMPVASGDDEAAERTSHLWSMGIGAVSVLLLVTALVIRSRTKRAG
jgi:hypothetical protein